MKRLLEGLSDYSPTLGLYAPLFWVAWITVIYSSDTIVVPVGDAYSTSSIDFVCSTLALCVTLFIAAVLSSSVRSLINDWRFMVAVAAVSAATTLGVSFAGALPGWLFYVSALGTGVATSFFAIRCFTLYAEANVKRIIIATCLSLLLGVLMYSLLSFCTMFFSSWMIAAITALLPAMGIFLSFVPSGIPGIAEDKLTVKMSPSFWKLTALLFLVTFGFSMIRGLYPRLISVAEFAMSRGQVAIALIVMCLVLVCVAACMYRQSTFTGFFYVLFAVSVAAVLPMFLLGADSAVAGVISSVGTGLLCFAGWTFLAYISSSSGMSSIRVFGFGYGMLSLGMTLGFLVGDLVGDIPSAALIKNAGIAITAVYLVVALFLLREKTLKKCLEPTAEMREFVAAVMEDAEAVEGAQEALAAESALEAVEAARIAPPEPADTEPPGKRGRFMQKCAGIAEKYGLSGREAEVFVLLAKGKEAQAIADELFISFNTARTHIRKIYSKLGIHSRRELSEIIDDFPLS